MGGQLSINGEVNLSPAASSDGSFPSAVTSIPFTLSTGSSAKPSAVDTGAKTRTVNSPGAFAALSGIGAADDVTQADTIYFRSSAAGFKVRLTFKDPEGGSDIVSVVPVAGILILEPDPNGYIKLVEVKGSGTIEFFASGKQ